jgi:F0F1-type ATP synthase assembly protein I
MSLIGPEGRRQLKLAARFASAGLELAVSIVVGYFGGGALDRWLGTAPYVGYAGLVLGIAAGFRTLFRLARSAQKAADSGPDNPGNPPSNDTP